MLRRVAVLLAVGSLAAVGVAEVPVAQARGTTASAACTRAKIGGQSKCIGRGQFCARSHRKDYRRYGLSCTKRDRNGRYHLQQATRRPLRLEAKRVFGVPRRSLQDRVRRVTPRV